MGGVAYESMVSPLGPRRVCVLMPAPIHVYVFLPIKSVSKRRYRTGSKPKPKPDASMSSLTHQLDMTLMRERLTAMEALLAEHKIKVPKPIKNVESSTMASMRINQRKLFAARALERLDTGGIEVSFSFARRTSRAAPAEFGLDVLECIAPFLDLPSLGALRQVNRQWRSTFYQGSIMKAIVGSMDYITFDTLYAMVIQLGSGDLSRDMMDYAVGGIPILRATDALRLIEKHGISWEKMARRHSANTALGLAFEAIPIPSHVHGKRYFDERQRCVVGLFGR